MVVEQRVVVSAQKDLASYEYLRERKLYVRMVERVRLGQGFDEVVGEVERLTQSPELSGGAVTTTVDATALGQALFNNLNMMFIEYVKSDMSLSALKDAVARQNGPVARLIACE